MALEEPCTWLVLNDENWMINRNWMDGSALQCAPTLIFDANIYRKKNSGASGNLPLTYSVHKSRKGTPLCSSVERLSRGAALSTEQSRHQ